MRILLLAAAAAASVAAPALAQSYGSNPRGQAADGFFTRCMQDTGGSPAHSGLGLECACGAGYMSGQATERQMAILREFMRARADSEFAQIAQRLVSEGYSAQEIQAAGQLLIDMEADVNATCFGLRQR